MSKDIETAHGREALLIEQNETLAAGLVKSKEGEATYARAYLEALNAKTDCERLVETLSRPSYASLHE